MVTKNSHEFVIATHLCECDHIPEWVRGHVHNCGICEGSSASPDYVDKAWDSDISTLLTSLGTFVGTTEEIDRVSDWSSQFYVSSLSNEERGDWLGLFNALPGLVRRQPHAH